jgi:hypothetical protein
MTTRTIFLSIKMVILLASLFPLGALACDEVVVCCDCVEPDHGRSLRIQKNTNQNHDDDNEANRKEAENTKQEDAVVDLMLDAATFADVSGNDDTGSTSIS